MTQSTMATIIIRSYQPSDLDACKALMFKCHYEYNNDERYLQHAFKTDMADVVKNYLEIPNGHWWVAVSLDDNRIVGQVAIQPVSIGSLKYYESLPLNVRDYVCELRRMAVASDFQRSGVGSRLLETFLEFAKEKGYREVHLTTLTNMKKACNFYRKHGFVAGNIERYSIREIDVKISSQRDPKFEECLTGPVIFTSKDEMLAEDLERMEQPPTQSKHVYAQHFGLAL